jgi:hypothetical protein
VKETIICSLKEKKRKKTIGRFTLSDMGKYTQKTPERQKIRVIQA